MPLPKINLIEALGLDIESFKGVKSTVAVKSVFTATVVSDPYEVKTTPFTFPDGKQYSDGWYQTEEIQVPGDDGSMTGSGAYVIPSYTGYLKGGSLIPVFTTPGVAAPAKGETFSLENIRGLRFYYTFTTQEFTLQFTS